MPCTEPDIPKDIARNVRIALAYDSAFCFYYADNISLLEELGCEIVPFSPLSDKALPENIGGLILGGGYPELYAEKLSENIPLLHEIKESISGGLPVIAECGGFMYLNESIEDVNGICRKMAGVINGQAYRTDRLQRFGYVSLTAKKTVCSLTKEDRSGRTSSTTGTAPPAEATCTQRKQAAELNMTVHMQMIICTQVTHICILCGHRNGGAFCKEMLRIQQK